METVNDMIRRGAGAGEVLQVVGAWTPPAQVLAEQAGDDFAAFWEACPSPFVVLRVAERAGVPLWLRVSAVRAAADEVANRLLPAKAIEKCEPLRAMATEMLARPGAEYRRSRRRCGMDLVVATADMDLGLLSAAHAALCKAAAVGSCRCEGPHEAADVSGFLTRAAEVVVDMAERFFRAHPVDCPDADGMEPKVLLALACGTVVCSEMRQVLDLRSVVESREWVQAPGAGKPGVVS